MSKLESERDNIIRMGVMETVGIPKTLVEPNSEALLKPTCSLKKHLEQKPSWKIS